MQEIDWIIQEQANLLKDKGYDEVALHTSNISSSYQMQMKEQLRDIIDNPDLQYSPSYFNIHLFGQFGMDAIAYTLTYSYDPLDKMLAVTEVAATMNEIKIVEPIENGSALWSSQQLYQRVKQMDGVVGPHLEQQRQLAVQQVLQEQASLLSQKGYGSSDKIFTRLNIELAGVLDQTSPDRAFVLKCKIKEQNFTVPLHARFHFQFTPAVPSLQLKSIHFKMSGEKELILKPDAKDIPIPRVIYSRLAQADTARRVNKIQEELNRYQATSNQQKKGK